MEQKWRVKNERVFNRALVIGFRIIYVCNGLFKWLFEWKERKRMSIDDVIYCLKARSDNFPQTCEDCQYYSSDSSCENEVCNMAIRSLEMQKKLGMDICEWI